MSLTAMGRRVAALTGWRRGLELDRAVRALAAEYGQTEAEVRADLMEGQALTRRFGACTDGEFVARCAADLGVPEAEVTAELTRAYNAVGISVWMDQ